MIFKYFKKQKILKKVENKLKKAGFIIDKKQNILKTPEGIILRCEGKSKDTTIYENFETFLNNDYLFYISNKAPLIFIDAGVNTAATTLYFANLANVSKVYAFEPFKLTYQKALNNINLNPELSKKITLMNYGLGMENKTIEIPYEETASGCMSTTFDVFSLNKENCNKFDFIEKVEIKDSFDAISGLLKNKVNEKVILKIDTEGAEFEILESLDKNNYLRTFDLIMMEYHFKDPSELIERLTANNFICIKKVGDGKKNIGMIYAVKTEIKD